MSMEATLATWALSKKIVTQTEKLFLLMCARRAGEDHTCWPGVERMTSDTGMDRKTIIKVRQSLIEKGLLRYTGEMKGRTNSVPVMQLTYVKQDDQISSPNSGTASDGSSPKNGTGSSPKNGTENSKEEYKRNIKENIKRKEEIHPTEKPSSGKNEANPLEDNPHNIPQEMIEDFMVNRKAKKAPLTKTAWNLINKNLTIIKERYGISPIDAFETMVASGWIAVKPEYFKDKTLSTEMTHPCQANYAHNIPDRAEETEEEKEQFKQMTKMLWG